MKRLICSLLAIVACGCPWTTAQAQSAGLVELYGEGVHRYFAGDLMGADELLSRVINSGSQDPRAYYFRGLLRERQGGGGSIDFEQGAQMEATGRSSYNVGMALMRIQGSVRGKIEKARRDARVMYAQQKAMMQEAYQPTPMAPAIENSAVPLVPAQPSETGAADPFADGGMRSEETSDDTDQPATPEIDETSDPFADDAPATDAPADSGDAADPFGDPSDAPAGDDPFGGDAGDDPFGGDPFGN
ncbi:MAG: hypothetical protein AB8B50_11490 [Pirellulaceae bacterium]